MAAERASDRRIGRGGPPSGLSDAGLADADPWAGDQASACVARKVASATADWAPEPASKPAHPFGDGRHGASVVP
jgi:hypothetical protein